MNQASGIEGWSAYTETVSRPCHDNITNIEDLPMKRRYQTMREINRVEE